MYLKLAVKEREKHKIIFAFIILQLSITFILSICCASIIEQQYRRYLSLKPMIAHDGWFIDTTLGVIYPEEDVGTGMTGMEVLQKHLKNTNIICTYSILGNIVQDSWEMEIEDIIYDQELIQAMNPKMAEGKWLTDSSDNPEEIEAVISQNYYGLGIGDTIGLLPYENADSAIPVKIIGILDEHAEILKMRYSKPMVNYNNFIFGMNNAERPILILCQEDILRLSAKSLSPKGLLFLQYNENITGEERKANEKFIENNIQIHIKEPLPIVQEKSKIYLNDQIAEILPLVLVAFSITMLSTSCICILAAKQHMHNLYIYYIVGYSRKNCVTIQFFTSLIVLSESAIVSVLIYITLHIKGQNFFLLNFGILQFFACLFIAILWMAATFGIQWKMLGNPVSWRNNK